MNQYSSSTWILFLYSFRFSTISICKSRLFMSFFTLVFQVIFVLPRPLCKFLKLQLSIFLTGSLILGLYTYPNHLKRFSFIFSSTIATPKPLLISSFQILSLKVCPLKACYMFYPNLKRIIRIWCLLASI